MLTNKNKQDKIEYILSNIPKILLDQYVTISKLINTFQEAPYIDDIDKRNKHKLKFLNDAYNAINVISKIVSIISNSLVLDNLQYQSETEEYKKAMFKKATTNIANNLKNRESLIKSYDKIHKNSVNKLQESIDTLNRSEEPIDDTLLGVENYDTLIMKPLDNN